MSGAAGVQPKAAGMGPKAEPDQAWLARGLASTGTSLGLPGHMGRRTSGSSGNLAEKGAVELRNDPSAWIWGGAGRR